MKKKSLAPVLLALSLLSASAAEATDLRPFTASYDMQRSGSAVGEATFSLRPAGDGWEYEQATRGTHGMAALAAASVDERSQLEFANGVLQIRSYRYHMSTLVKSSDRSVDVDPASNSILIRDKKHQLTFPMQAGVLDQNSPHGLRGGMEKMGAICPRQFLIAHQAQISLVHKCRWLEGVIAALLSHAVAGEVAKLLVDQGKQRLGGLRASPTCFLQKTGNVFRGMVTHANPSLTVARLRAGTW